MTKSLPRKVKVGFSLVRFPNPLLEVGWDYTAPIGGEFFSHPPSATNLDSTWPRGCLLDCSTSKEATCSSPTFFSLTGLAVCTPFLSSARMQLLLEAGIAVGFLIFQLSDFLRQNATFVFAENKCKCICQAVHFIFLLCRGSPIRVDHFRELKKWSSSPWLHKIVRQFTIWSSIIFCV